MLFNLDRQCRESAIRFASKNGIDKNIFINFLPSAIYNPEFCLRDTVKWASDLDFNPDNIIFEVVETEDVEDTEHLKQILQFYKDKGFRTALDDVGSGYASLSLFASLRPNIIKIDIDIVRDVHISDFKQAVAKALKIMADESGCKVLAEGIETKEEFDWFKNLGVDYAQGYYLAKPSPEPVSSISIK
jgi:EAL domain-containing protein (putative c-di-GMP-specific phosphodiesterase class I)